MTADIQLRADADREIERLRTDGEHVVDALIVTQDRLAALEMLMKLASNSLELSELTGHILDVARELTESDLVLLRTESGETVVGEGGGWGPDPRLHEVLTAALQREHRGAGLTADATFAAVQVQGSAGGVLGVARQIGPAYSTGDLRMLETVASAVAQATQLAKLHATVVQQVTLEREHRLASALAQAVMPELRPRPLPGLDLFASCRPAAVTGGDFLVFAEVAGTLWFAVGDVAGKGLPAATIMTRAVAATRVAFLTHAGDDPASAVASVSAELSDYLQSVDSFITLIIGTHEPGSGVLTVCNAGHSPVVYRESAAAPAWPLPPSLPPLGVEHGRGRNLRRPFDPGSLLLIGTDGLVEQPSPQGDLLGYDRFLASCAGGGTETAADLGERLFAAVSEHAAGLPAADDQSLLVLRGTETGR